MISKSTGDLPCGTWIIVAYYTKRLKKPYSVDLTPCHIQQPFYFYFRQHRIILQSITPTFGLCAQPGISDSMKDTLKIFWMTAPGCCKQTLNTMHAKKKKKSLFSLEKSGGCICDEAVSYFAKHYDCSSSSGEVSSGLSTTDWCCWNNIYWHCRVQG